MSAGRLDAKDLRHRLLAAWRGRRLWLRLCRRHDIERGLYVLLLCEDDPDLNTTALRHVPSLVADRRARGALLLVAASRVPELSVDERRAVIGVEALSEREMDDLVAFRELYPFSERLVVVSLDRPHGTRLRNLVGVHGVTLDDAVRLGLLRLRSGAPA